MDGFKAYLRFFLAAACIVVSIASLINVFADNSEVVGKAKQLGCPAHGACDIARVDRNPFGQTFDFRTTHGTVTVKCARSILYFFGDYRCEKQ